MALRVLLFLHLLLPASLSVSSLRTSGFTWSAKELCLESDIITARWQCEAPGVLYKFGRLEKNITEQHQRSLDKQEEVSRLSAETQILGSSHVNVSHSQLGITPSPIHPHTSSYLRQPSPSKSSRHDSSSYPISSIKHLLSYVIQAITRPLPITLLLSIIWLYFSGSFFFDLAHWTLHKFAKSTSPMLRKIGYMHEVHHLYFNRRLKFNDRYRWQNICYELPLELSCQLLGTWLGYLLVGTIGLTGTTLISKEILVLVLVFEILRSCVVACMEGHDSNHKSYSSVVPKDPHLFLVGPEYHALHHVDPSAYIGSTFKIFDWFLGTSCSLQSRRITIGGSLGVFGAALKAQLLRESVSCVEELSFVPAETEAGYDSMIELLSRTDILIIDSDLNAASLVELFKKHHKAKAAQSLLLPEVWQCSSDTEKGTSDQIRRYQDDEDMLFRHIDSHTSGKWLEIRPEVGARMAIWWIRRGLRTVPATFDLLALFRFVALSRYVEQGLSI